LRKWGGSGGGFLENPKRFVGDAGTYVPNGLGSGVVSRLLMLKGDTLAESFSKASSSDSGSGPGSCSNISCASWKGWLPDDPVLPVLGPGVRCSRVGLSPELLLLDECLAVNIPRLGAVVSSLQVALSFDRERQGFVISRFKGSRY
jgi:hypothetical protein